MKRYPVVIGVTAAGLAGVLAYHTHGTALGPSTPVAATSGPTGGSPPGNGPSPSTSTTAPAAGTAPSSTPTTTTPTTTAPATLSATGSPEQYGYGVLSVRVTASGAKLTKLAVATLQTAEAYSQQLARDVIPILRREVLAAQSARIAAISGATYTSEAYAASVQSALDKLHLK